MDLEVGDIVCKKDADLFLLVVRKFVRADSIRYECHTHSNSLYCLSRDQVFLFTKKRDISYKEGDLVYAWHENNFFQATITKAGSVSSSVQFLETNLVQSVRNEWMYPSSWRIYLGSHIAPSVEDDCTVAKRDSFEREDDGCGYESSYTDYDLNVAEIFDKFSDFPSGGLKDDPLPESEDTSLRIDLPRLLNKTSMILGRLCRPNLSEDGYQSPYEEQDPVDMTVGLKAGKCIISTNKGRAKTGKYRGYFLPGSICMFQFNRGAWTVFCVLISTSERREKDGYVEFRVCVLESLADRNIGIWCKCFKCHKNTIVATQCAPKDVRNVFTHYADKFIKSKTSVVSQTMPLASNMDARHCTWCKFTEVIRPDQEEDDGSDKKSSESDHASKPRKKSKVSFGEVQERVVSRPSFECLWSLSFDVFFDDMYHTVSYALRRNTPGFLKREHFMDIIDSNTVPDWMYSFLPDREANRDFAELACYFLNTSELAIYSPDILDYDSASLIACLLDVEDRIYAVVMEKPSRVHLLETKGSFFATRHEFQDSAVSSVLDEILMTLGFPNTTIFSYQLPDQYCVKEFVWEHSVVMLLILSSNLKQGSDNLWTTDENIVYADFHRKKSCLHNCSITSATFKSMKLYVLSLYFAALELNNITLVNQNSDQERLEFFTQIPAHLDSQIQGMIEKSLNTSGNSVYCYNSPRFYEKAIKKISETFQRDPNAVPLSHFLAAVIQRVTGDKFKKQTCSTDQKLFELGNICRPRQVSQMALPCKAIVHELS